MYPPSSGVLPRNPIAAVQKVAAHLGLTLTDTVPTLAPHSVEEVLLRYPDLLGPPKRSTLRRLAKCESSLGGGRAGRRGKISTWIWESDR